MSTTTNTAPADDVRPIHQPFSWVPNVAGDDQEAHFAALTADICNGVRTCLQLVQSTDMALYARTFGDDDQPLLSRVDREHLLLLSTAAVRMLGQQAYQRADYLNDQARKAAAAGQRGAA